MRIPLPEPAGWAAGSSSPSDSQRAHSPESATCVGSSVKPTVRASVPARSSSSSASTSSTVPHR